MIISQRYYWDIGVIGFAPLEMQYPSLTNSLYIIEILVLNLKGISSVQSWT